MDVQPADVRRHLERLLGEESRLLAELEQLLTRESAVVRGDDPAAIERIGSSRHQCVSALTRLDAERMDACRMLSYPANRDGFEKLLAWCDPTRPLHAQWQRNLQVARRCKELNDRNGAIVALKLGQVRQLLSTLRGGTTAPSTYGRQGARFEGFQHRELGQA
jgi:flagellar biosynthesis/type III secretory pathway chaperone